MKTLQQLRQLWEQEKHDYLDSEVGSGVQRFVRELLECGDVFGLRQGLKSTPAEKRRNEFLLEERNKEGQADAIIFIDSDIVIPVEVEKLGKAQGGEWQIIKYQRALDKKYGILTDGEEWRFYYGEIEEKQYYRFTIEEIFEETERFITFWSEYIKPKNYYLSFFENIGQQKLFEEKEIFSVEKNKGKFFEDVTGIIKKLKDKFLNAGYLQTLKNDERAKKTTEIAYSYLIQFILYKSLVDNHFSSFKEDFFKIEERIHQNLKKGSFVSILGILEGLSAKISENIYKPFHTEQELILRQITEIIRSGDENIMDVAPFLDIFVFVKKYSFSNVQNDIFGTIYENYLKELYEEQKFGQYFTDPAVVNFMLEEIGYSAEEIKKRNHENISIIDPSCGSGTFLYSAVRELIKSRDFSDEKNSKMTENEVIGNVFGLDIAEFPLYLAEMSILMKMLPMIVNQKYNNPIDKKLKLFVTEDSIAEFVEEVGVKGSAKGSIENQIQMDFGYTGFMRDTEDLKEMKRSLKTLGSGKSLISRKRFDYVIGNPPYIHYNECCKLGISIFKKIKNKIVGLNNIYGFNLHSVPNRRKPYRPNPNIYAFFVALGFALLKPNGRFSYIIPQTLLTAGDLDVLRYQLANEYTIEKLITFKGCLFIDRGTSQKKKVATSSLIIVCSKEKPKANHQVECLYFPEGDLEAEKVFQELRLKREKYRKLIPQNILKEQIENWNFIKWDLRLVKLYEKYKRNSQSMEMYSNHKKAESSYKTKFYFDGGYSFKEQYLSPYPNLEGVDFYRCPQLDKDYFGVYSFKGFFPNIRSGGGNQVINLRQANQGYNLLDSNYKIVWSTKNPQRFHFTEDKVIWANIRLSGIGSDNKNELLYLFSILNSSFVFFILNSLVGSESEKDLLVPIKSVKEYVRPPVLDTPQKEATKAEVITLAERMLDIEKQTLGDLTEINSLMQIFDDVRVVGADLILKSGTVEIKAKIKAGNEKIIKKALDEYFGGKKLLEDKRIISLSELLVIPAFDHEKQMGIKKEIDEKVLELYGLKTDFT